MLPAVSARTSYWPNRTGDHTAREPEVVPTGYRLPGGTEQGITLPQGHRQALQPTETPAEAKQKNGFKRVEATNLPF